MQKSLYLLRSGFFARLAVGVCLLIMVLLGVSLTGVLGSSIAHADSGQANFALQPVLYDTANPLTQSYFIFDSKPGTPINSRVRVTNTGTAKGSVSLYPVDATTGQTSGAVYLNHDDPRKDVGAWTTLGAQQLTLNPGQNQVVSFQVTIPGYPAQPAWHAYRTASWNRSSCWWPEWLSTTPARTEQHRHGHAQTFWYSASQQCAGAGSQECTAQARHVLAPDSNQLPGCCHWESPGSR